MMSWEEKIANNMNSHSCESRNPVGNKRVDSRLHGKDNVSFYHSSESRNPLQSKKIDSHFRGNDRKKDVIPTEEGTQYEEERVDSRWHGNDRTSECLSFAIMNILIIKQISAFARMTFNKKSIFQKSQYNL